MDSTKARFCSGGAHGADLEWAQAARASGLDVEIMSFHGAKRHVPTGARIREVPPDILRSVDQELLVVSKALGRKLPKPGYTLNLLRRNILVARQARAVYAVTTLTPGDPDIPGGTAWACRYHELFSPRPQLYVYDMATNRWVTRTALGWVEQAPPPPASHAGKVALIGSRDLTGWGVSAIRSMFGL